MEIVPDLLECDVAVVGGGIHGTAAALHAARDGRRTVLLEQFPLPNTRGSSAGQSRITRLANMGAPEMTPIMKDSFARWREIEKEIGIELFIPAPFLSVGTEEMIETNAKVIRECGETPEILSIGEVNQRYRTSFPEGLKGVVDPTAGVLKADKCIAHLRDLFQKAGGIVHDNWPVRNIDPGPVVTLSGEKGKVRTTKLILCAGPWTAKVLRPLGVDLPLRPEKTAHFFCKVEDPDFPVFSFVDLSHDPKRFFMMPSFEYPGHVKFGCYDGSPIDPDKRDAKEIAWLRNRVLAYINGAFPGIEPVCAVEEALIFQISPDNKMIVDRHPSHPNIVYATGFSGAGFKIAPTLGEALYRMVMDLPPKFDISHFSTCRFLHECKGSVTPMSFSLVDTP